MVDLNELQKAVWQNKVDHGFNTTDINEEFCLLTSEIGEAYRARSLVDQSEFAEELAYIAIYLLGIAEMKHVDLEAAILKKIEKNRRRRYFQREDGSWGKTEGN